MSDIRKADSYQNFGMPQQGWLCPKCGTVNAPFMPHCPRCAPPGTQVAKDTTGTNPKANMPYTGGQP